MSIKLNLNEAAQKARTQQFFDKSYPGVNKPWSSSTSEQLAETILKNRVVQAFVNEGNEDQNYYLKDINRSPKYLYRQATSNK